MKKELPQKYDYACLNANLGKLGLLHQILGVKGQGRKVLFVTCASISMSPFTPFA